jgi:uncharacterized protein YcnI
LKRTSRLVVLACAALVGLVVTASASAHAHVSPLVSVAKQTQLYTLSVPTEKEGATTTKIVLTVPKGFSIDSFVPSPGWKRVVQSTGSGENTVFQKVTWTGGKVPTEEDSNFAFLAEPAKSGTYSFEVEQTYSDGEIVNWSGPESSDTPSATIEAKNSLGSGGGSSTLSIVALVVGAVGVLLGGAALIARSGRELA